MTLDETAAAQFGHHLLDLGLGVHDDGAVPGDRLADRLAGNQEEADALVDPLDGDLVPLVEQDQRLPVRSRKTTSRPSISFPVKTPWRASWARLGTFRSSTIAPRSPSAASAVAAKVDAPSSSGRAADHGPSAPP